MVNTGRYSVVRSRWLLRSRRAGRLLPFSPSELLHATPATRLQTQLYYDMYCDSYTQHVDVDTLRTLVNGESQ